MTETMLARARIKPGKTDRLRAWYDELDGRESEVIETLRHEGVYTETAFIQSIDGTEYLYGYMEASDLKRAQEAGEKEAYEIDEKHHAVLDETLTDDWQELEPIGHFTNPDRE
jgi:hypothetical protein